MPVARLVGLPPRLGRGGEQAVLVRREGPGQRGVALDHLEQGLLLPEEVLVGTGDDRHRDGAGQSGPLHLRQGPLESVELPREPALDADVHADGVHCHRGDGEALDHLVGVGPQDGPVLERGRFPFGRVADDVPVGPRRVADARPLPRRRKAATAPPPQPGQRQLGDGLRRAQRGRPGQPVTAAQSSPGVDRRDRLDRQQEWLHPAGDGTRRRLTYTSAAVRPNG
jgi:hypothetical protein